MPKELKFSVIYLATDPLCIDTISNESLHSTSSTIVDVKYQKFYAIAGDRRPEYALIIRFFGRLVVFGYLMGLRSLLK